MKTQILIIPGMHGSDENHWQSKWEALHSEYIRVEQDDWDNPDYTKWLERLESVLSTIDEDVILVAHSMGTHLVANFARDSKLTEKIKGAFLVAVPDYMNPEYPKEALNFTPLYLDTLPFKTIAIASTTDRYADIQNAKIIADTWGAEFINIGDFGHINSDSNLGDWNEGEDIFMKFLRSIA